MRALYMSIAAGILFAFALYTGAALLWTDSTAMLSSMGWLLVMAVLMGLFTSFAMPRPVGGRLLATMFVTALAAGLFLALLAAALGPRSLVEPMSFSLVLLPGCIVWILAFGMGQLTRRRAEI